MYKSYMKNALYFAEFVILFLITLGNKGKKQCLPSLRRQGIYIYI